MRRNRGPSALTYWLLLAFAVGLGCSAADAQSSSPNPPAALLPPSELLGTLQKFDTVYMTRFTAIGSESMVETNGVKAPVSTDPVTIRWKFVTGPTEQAVIEDHHVVPPKFIPKPQDGERPRGNRNVAYDVATGAMHQTVRSRVITLFAEEKSGQIITDTTFKVLPGKGAEKQHDNHLTQFATPDSPDLTLPVKQHRWCAGRGLSHFLHEITAQEATADGTVKATAVGFMDRRDENGRWELVIDPAASFMVRRAEYFPPGATIPFIKMENAGLKTNGACQYPEKATFVLSIAGFVRIKHVTYDLAELKVDQPVLDEAKRALDGKPPPNTHVSDYRTTPHTHYMIDSDGNVFGQRRDAEISGSGPTRSKRWWYVVLFTNLAILLVIGVIAYRRRVHSAGRV